MFTHQNCNSSRKIENISSYRWNLLERITLIEILQKFVAHKSESTKRSALLLWVFPLAKLRKFISAVFNHILFHVENFWFLTRNRSAQRWFPSSSLWNAKVIKFCIIFEQMTSLYCEMRKFRVYKGLNLSLKQCLQMGRYRSWNE